MSMIVKKISYQGWPNCYLLSDETVEIIATADIGPRIIRCGFVGGPNFFAEFSEQLGQTGGDSWRIYGGHRLWHSPESRARTYFPDNTPLQVKLISDGLILKQSVESNTGIKKIIQIKLDPMTHIFTVEHSLTNCGNWPVLLAPWAISVMRPGGLAVIPQYREADAEGLLPNRLLSLWPYTEMNDSRVTWGSKFILLKQDVAINNPFKLGISVPQGWMAYLNEGSLFVKTFLFNNHGTYPDGGVNVELYTNHAFLEMESLGTLKTLNPGETAIHTENWTLADNVGVVTNEVEAEKQIVPRIR